MGRTERNGAARAESQERGVSGRFSLPNLTDKLDERLKRNQGSVFFTVTKGFGEEGRHKCFLFGRI
jgi:hypothetical protein